MAINLSKFVDIKINYHLTTSSKTTRDTVVLIVGSATETSVVDIDSFDKFKGIYGVSDPMYYYGHCFFTNGGKKIKLIKKMLSSSIKATEKKQPSDFTSGTFYIDNSTGTIATPQNSNNGSALNELDKYVKTTDTEIVEGKAYYKKEGNQYVKVDNPDVEELSNYYEAKVKPTEDPTFQQDKIYYKDANTIATPFVCGLYESVRETSLTPNEIVEEVEKLDNDYVIITSDVSWDIMKAANDAYNQKDKSIKSKMFISSITPIEYNNAISNKSSIASVKDGFVLKYGVRGIEMSVAAYLTQINVNRFNSVKDYEFTIENVEYSYTNTSSEKITVSSVYEENSLVEALIEANINVDSTLVNAVRNLGGNDLNGNDLVNEFMLILLHQTLTERLVQLLAQKIKYNQTGLSLIGATIASELQRYVDNGYLTTDKAWTDPDLVYEGITIVKQNTPLQIGYKYVIFPFSSLSNDERAEHKLPPIYILIADSYSIRQIEITGEVF